MQRAPVSALLKRRYNTEASNIACLGMRFQNRLGLAAGLDKNGDYIDALASIGFGHIEIGTVTPRAQAGNPPPRLFRLPNHKALINRMGFNNKGVDHLVSQVQRSRFKGVLGINIGKNASTPLELAGQDYLHGMQKVYPHADYITINISSPNTEGLRDLQHGKRLQSLLDTVKNEQARLATEHNRYVPLAVKIAPDMSQEQLTDFCQSITELEIDAVVASNTSNSRNAVKNHLYAKEAGGLSGAPIRSLADNTLDTIAERLDNQVIIGAGGVSCGNDARKKLALGASLVQLYSGFIYHGPALVRDCINATSDFHAPDPY